MNFKVEDFDIRDNLLVVDFYIDSLMNDNEECVHMEFPESLFQEFLETQIDLDMYKRQEWIDMEQGHGYFDMEVNWSDIYADITHNYVGDFLNE